MTGWHSVSKLGIVGPYFFEKGETAVTVTLARYVDVLNNFLHPEFLRRRINMRQMWFQQDGATVHTARASMEVVRRMFPQHVISRFGEVSWPPRSFDSLCDFFLWGHLKARVYTNRSRTIQELKLSIRQEIAPVPEDMLENEVQNFEERLQMCVQQERTSSN
jgi:hypothetical protein